MKVQVYHLINRLKAKLGMQAQGRAGENPEGYIDPEAIEEADKMIEKLCAECPQTMGAHLESIAALWNDMKDMPRSPERETLSQEVFTLAHEIKDVGAMCGYDLVAYFAESLRDYIAKTELKLEAQRVIIQAHVDALQVVIKQDLKDEADGAAAELKQMVRIAIDKYS